MKLIIANIPALLCVLVAAYLALENVNGWGWFLVPACLLVHFISQKGN
jgi:hypothetical protein